MIKAERQDKIKQLLDERGSAAVKDIAANLGVSEMTVRRDLEEMSSLGEIVRVHGGARTNGSPRQSMLRREYSYNEKRSKHAAEKAAVAERAARLIEPDSTIFLGASTTVEQMIPHLPACHLRIVTNSLSVFNLVEGRPDCDLCLVGGTYRARTGAFVGPLAEDFISKIGLDAAFIGANGVFEAQTSTSNIEEGKFQQLAFEQADSRYLLVDASKIGKRDFFNFYSLEDLDAVVCDASLEAGQRASIEEYTTLLLS